MRKRTNTTIFKEMRKKTKLLSNRDKTHKSYKSQVRIYYYYYY
jgi:hypothetical protein